VTRPDPSRLGLPPFIAQCVTIAGAALAGAGVAAVGVPAGWLSGAMMGTALLAALRVAEPLTTPFRWAAMVSSGVAIGAAVTPQMLQKIAAYPISIAIMAASVAISTFACAKILERAPGWSRSTAFFASVPGALSYVFAVAATDEKADLSRIAVVQVLRVFLLMGFVPLIVAESGASLAGAPTGPIDPLLTLALLTILGGLAGYLMERAQVAGGMLFGAMLVSGGAHALSIAPGSPPPIVAIIAQVLIGAWVGARFIGFDWRLFAKSAPAALGSFLVAVGIAGLFAVGAGVLLSLPFAQTLLAFSPGGLEAMTLLAFAMGIDPLYVGAHHLARFLLISFTLPLALRFWMKRSS